MAVKKSVLLSLLGKIEGATAKKSATVKELTKGLKKQVDGGNLPTLSADDDDEIAGLKELGYNVDMGGDEEEEKDKEPEKPKSKKKEKKSKKDKKKEKKAKKKSDYDHSKTPSGGRRIERGSAKKWFLEFWEKNDRVSRDKIFAKYIKKFGETSKPTLENYIGQAKKDKSLLGNNFLGEERNDKGVKILFLTKEKPKKAKQKDQKPKDDKKKDKADDSNESDEHKSKKRDKKAKGKKEKKSKKDKKKAAASA